MRERRLSATYYFIAALLEGGFRGCYSDLAAQAATHQRAAGRIVKAFYRRNPGWDFRNVFAKTTGLPANEGNA